MARRLALLVLLFALPARAGETVHVRGRVVEAGTRHGLRALVRLQSLTGALQLTRETGDDGRFDFEVPPDRYNLEASVGGFDEEERDLPPDGGGELELALRRRVYQSTVVPPARESARDGASAFTLDAEQLRALPGGVDRELPDLLRVEPGVTPDALGQNHVRGNYSDVRYWLDGVPLPAALSNQLLTLVPVEVVDRVELITGGLPAELDGVAGAALVQTAIPEHGHLGWVRLGYGTYDTLHPAAGIAARIGKLGLLVAGDFQMTARGLDSPTATPITHDHLQSGSGLARLTYAITPRDQLDLHVAFRLAQMEIPIDTSLRPLSEAPPGARRGPDEYGNEPPRFVPYDANPTQVEHDVFASLGYRHRFERRGEIFGAAMVRISDGALRCDAPRALGAGADPGSACSDVAHRAQSYGGLVHYTVPLGAHHRLKVGVQLDDRESDVGYTQYTRDDAAPLGGPDPALTASGSDRTRVLGFGAFAQDRFTWRRLTVLAGLRFDLQDIFLPGGGALLYESPSARLGATLALGRLTVLHAFVGYLWQAPSLDAPTAARALGLVPANQPIVYDLAAEETWSGELGVEVRPLPALTAHATVWGRLSTSPLDDEEVGNTELKAEYNYRRGRAYGLELGARTTLGQIFSAFGNLSLQQAAGQGIASAKYLFTPEQFAYAGWQPFDHQQTVTANLGVDLHDRAGRTHFEVLVQYGSGLRTGETNNHELPQHVTVDVGLRHAFEWPGRPEIAVEALNLLNEAYALRIGNASVVGSAWAPLRRLFARLTWHF